MIVNVTLSPTLCVPVLAVLVTKRLVSTTGVAVAVLFAELVSGSLPEIIAVFAYGPEALTVATIDKVALCPLIRLPTVQFGADHVPTDGVALTKV